MKKAGRLVAEKWALLIWQCPPNFEPCISNYTGRFAVYLSVEHVKINVHQQAVQAYGMWVEKVGKFYLFYILLTLFEAIAI